MKTLRNYEPEITVNLNSRKITIPSELYNIGVVSDDNAELVKIRIPRYFDGNDFSTRKCTISYNNALKERGVYSVKEMEIKEDYLLLSWHVSKFATKKSGKIYFVVEFKSVIDERGMSYSWSTLAAELNVMPGLDDDIIIDEHDISLYQSLLSHINATDKKLADLMTQIGDISLLIYEFELLKAQTSDLQSLTDHIKNTVSYIDTEEIVMEE